MFISHGHILLATAIKLTRSDVSLLIVMLLNSHVMDGSKVPRATQSMSTVVLAFAVVLELNIEIFKLEKAHPVINAVMCSKLLLLNDNG